jgi:hypothetical protein
MSVNTKKSITWLWIASLLIATVGVSGQQIYCYCMGKTTFSLFSAEDACIQEQKKQSATCCQKSKSAPVSLCCEKKDHANTTHGCNKKTTRVFQLKTEFTIQENAVEKLPAPCFELDFIAAFIPVFQGVLYTGKTGFQAFAQPPPPLSGRMICVRHGVFRC